MYEKEFFDVDVKVFFVCFSLQDKKRMYIIGMNVELGILF